MLLTLPLFENEHIHLKASRESNDNEIIVILARLWEYPSHKTLFMKRYFIYGLFAILFNSPVCAQPLIIPQSVIGAFHQRFSQAESVEWKTPGSSFVVTFLFQGHYYNAKFSKESRLIEIKRYISRFDLPILLQKSLEHYLGKFWITSVSFVEKPTRPMTCDVVLEDATSRIVLKSVSDAWQICRIVPKNG